MHFYMTLQFLPVHTPASLRTGLLKRQPVFQRHPVMNAASGYLKAPGRFGFAATSLDKPYDSFAYI
jgi:hypothetical protein